MYFYLLNCGIMELIIKSNDEGSIQKIIDFAKKLNVTVEKKAQDTEKLDREAIKQRIINFKASYPDTFGDASEWQRQQREDRDLPFSLLG